MAVCVTCKTDGLGRPGGMIFHACDDWGHFRLYVCSTCLENTPLQHSLHEQCLECADLPPETEAWAGDGISPRFDDLSVAIARFERVHRKLFARVPFVAYSENQDACHPGSLNTSSLKRWLQKYGGDDRAGT